MAFTKVVGAGIHTLSNITSHNIHSSGIVTATGLDISGDATIGGVLTYEDVTSIDSVGLITARNGIDCNADLDVDGHTNLDNVSIAGVTTLSSNKSEFDSTGTLYLNSGGSVNSGNYLTKIGSDGSADFLSNISIADKIIHYGDTNTSIRFPANDTITAETGGNERVRIKSDGKVGINTTSPARMLHIFSGNTGHPVVLERGDSSNTQIEIRAGGATRGYWGASTTANFLVYDNDASDINFTVLQTGNVGINRTNPDQRLNVSGNIELNAYDSAGGSGGYYTSKGLIIGNAYDAGKTGLTDDRNSIIWSERGLDLDIATNDTLRMKIKSDGNITQTIGSDGDGFTITAGDMKPMLTGNSNRSAHNNTIFGISGKWNNTEIGRIAFEAGPDTTNKDDGKIRLYTRPSGGSLTQRIDIADDGKITVAAGSDIRFTNGTWTGEVAGKIQHNSNNLYIQGGTGGIRFRHASSGTNQFSMTNGGNFEITDGDLVVASGHGIDFGATANGGSGTPSELLDDYEEGSFAPEVDNLSSGYGSGTFYNRTCKYTKVGNMVTCWGHLQWWGNAVTSGNDNLELTITGFPFEVDGVGYRGTCGGSVVAQSWRYSGSGWNNYHTDSDNVQVGINASEQIRFFVYTHNSIVGTVTQKSINGYSPNIEFCFQVRVTSYK